jgi:phosphoglycolate phosphatase-like HAD superfamily hydrolase
MRFHAPHLLALDFDGVLCNGLKEYFATAWRAYCRLWQVEGTDPPAGVAESFYRLRPVVETGWEMPVLVRSLVVGISESDILAHWSEVCQRIVEREELEPAILAVEVDGIRDEWIAADLDGWLAIQQFYPGTVRRLQLLLESSVRVAIVSTKEGRFIRQLLDRQGITFPADAIFGKEAGQPKHDTLRQLLNSGRDRLPQALWFVEDRLKTLQSVRQQTDLVGAKLFLAEWGYTTAADRRAAEMDGEIQLLSLAQFADDFAAWERPNL